MAFFNLLLQALALSVASRGALAAVTPFEACLQAKVTGGSSLVLPSSPQYTNATVSNNLALTYEASAVVFVSNPADASAAIKCATAAHVPVVSRGGRHARPSAGRSIPGRCPCEGRASARRVCTVRHSDDGDDDL